MTYIVHSIFKTIQGEGALMGRSAVFCRFAGCNLWSGREQDRTEAVCKFCDTEFVGGTKYQTAEELAGAIEKEWGYWIDGRMVVLTGGEPTLQYDVDLYLALRSRDFFIAIETNGTKSLPASVDWICVSPKAGATVMLEKADELKIVWPQSIDPEALRKQIKSDYCTLQPMDSRELSNNIKESIDYVMHHPHWRLGIQAHKYWGVE